MSQYDYRGARDWAFGIVRHAGSDKVKEIIATPATLPERTLLLALVEFAPNIEPSLATLAKMLGIDARSVRRHLRSCEAKRLLRVVPRSVGGLHTSNHYELLCTPGLNATTDLEPVLTPCPNPTDTTSGGVRTPRPTKQTNKADKKADKESARSRARQPELPLDPKVAAEHKQLTALYFEQYESARGSKPPFDGRDGKAIKDLLAKCGPDSAAKAIRDAFGDDWWRTKVTIRDIANDPAKFVGMKSGSGRSRQAQPEDRGPKAWKPDVITGDSRA